MARKAQTGKIGSGGCPYSSRRQVLLGLGAASGGAAVLTPAWGDETVARRVTDAPTGHADEAMQRVPFYGVHQAGVVNPRPANGIVAAFDVVAPSLDALDRMFRELTERIVFLTSGGKPPQRDPRLPPTDSGILGPVIAPDSLTVTVGLGASMFEGRPWLEPLKPKRLQRMRQFPNDALDPERCHGDLSLQFCANLRDTNLHALRDIIKHMSEFMVLRWMQQGDVPVIPPKPDGSTETARNFLGFHDGSANPDTSDDALMDQMIWINSDSDEPAWGHGGTYLAARIIRMFVERWDRTPLKEQEAIIGRKKASGAPFDGRTEHDVPHYGNDPLGEVTPLDAHMRLANPRTPETRDSLLLRRGFNFSNGVATSGQLDQGLLFLTYQADLEKGFIAVQNRLNGEPLEEYIKPIGGGYFFVLPGARRAGDYLGRTLVEAAKVLGNARARAQVPPTQRKGVVS